MVIYNGCLKMTTETFIVTGGSGFIGVNLCDYLAKHYPQATILNLSKHTYAVSPKTAKYLEAFPNYRTEAIDISDIMRLYQLIKNLKVTRIYHLAAESHVDRSFTYPRDFLQANIEGTFNLLEITKNLKPKPRFYYMGTDEIFGSVLEGYNDEGCMPHPENPYAATKVASEALCMAWSASWNIPMVIGRSMNVFGPRQNPEKLIPKIITHLINKKPYHLYKGNSMRGWSFVYDTVQAIDKIMTDGKNGEIYHITPCGMKGVYDINEYLMQCIPEGKKFFEGYVGKRLKDDSRYALASDKMQFELNWKPKWTWETGITETIEWYRHMENSIP